MDGIHVYLYMNKTRGPKTYSPGLSRVEKSVFLSEYGAIRGPIIGGDWGLGWGHFTKGLCLSGRMGRWVQ